MSVVISALDEQDHSVRYYLHVHIFIPHSISELLQYR